MRSLFAEITKSTTPHSISHSNIGLVSIPILNKAIEKNRATHKKESPIVEEDTSLITERIFIEHSMDLNFIRSQWLHLPVPAKSFEGQTIIVTGSNQGLGFEASRHFVRLGASKVILAVRSIRAGEEAAKNIHESTNRQGVCEVWQVDVGNWDSVKSFVKRTESLERLDVVVENAGVAKMEWSQMEGMETSVAINVVGTFLMALGLLPVLRAKAKKTNVTPRLVIVTSEIHAMVSGIAFLLHIVLLTMVQSKLAERNEDSIFDALNKNIPEYIGNRYPTTKLLEIFMVRALAPRMSSGLHAKEPVILNCINPGLCRTNLSRDVKGLQRFFFTVLLFCLARTVEVGSRTLVASAEAGEESHGQYMSDCKISEPSPFVRSDEGMKTQERVYTELIQILEKIQPGISKNI
jgi:NAD(P)-dependent dehydrogenase (short-subunit alcohol dehydrogenase family)